MGRFGLKIAMCPIFIKSGIQSKLNMLIINILIGIDVTWPKITNLQNLISKLKFSPIFMKFGTQQIKHANYEYSTCQCLEHSLDYWLKMIIGCKVWLEITQPAITCSKLTIEILEQGVKYIQS